MTNIKLRPLSKKFIQTLRVWRNQNRKYFFWQGIITPQMQKKWYEKYKKDPNDTIYIVFYEGRPVGTLATTMKGEDVEIGRVMLGDKNLARKGIMGVATEKLLSKFRGKRVFLEVIKGNEIAVSFYKKHKFKIVSKSENKVVMQRYT